MKEYFRLQFVMLNRRLADAGISPLLGYLLGFAAFVLLAEYSFHKTAYAKYLLVLLCVGQQFRLSEKNRTEFLRSTFGDKTKVKIRTIENLIVCILFVAVLLPKGCWMEAGFLCATALLLALFSFHSNFNLTIPTPFSKRPFEFSTGLRKTFFIYPLAYSLSIVAFYMGNVNFGLFSFVLVFVTIMSYYAKPEHEYYVWVHASSPQVFLRKKVISATINAGLLALPLLVALLILFPSEWRLISLFYFIGLMFLWAVVLAKYSAYPNEMNVSEGIAIALCIYFPPLLLAMIPYFYLKSVRRLKPILNDQN
jgi:hypothetical protein